MQEKVMAIIKINVFDDCRYFAEWEVMPEVTEFLTIDEDRDYEQIVKEFVRYSMDPTKLQFTITLKPEDKPIGKVYLSRINRADDSLDITRIYIADVENRGKGLGEEALRLVLEYAFIHLHMERVTLDHFEKNKPAAALCCAQNIMTSFINRQEEKIFLHMLCNDWAGCFMQPVLL